ncbi:cupredoxin domain-containing protein [Cucumibacter marinus]|uniref:copper-binding protein n=1 Tax=Cucumibacter marinus TaxID=1121252 RepID=UPI0012DE10D3|nr:copper-binding protein [Cucumibacter marinus]
MLTRRTVLKGGAAILAASLMPSAPASAHNGMVHIRIKGFAFDHDPATVKPGETLEFSNEDAVPHTATAADGSWDTGLIAPGTKAFVVFGAGFGTDYFCRFHPNMKASLAAE